MAALTTCRSVSPILPIFRPIGGLCRDPTLGKALLGVRRLRNTPESPPGRGITADNEVVNTAALEQGVTRYFCNRNPRNAEMLGLAEKPKGFETMKNRVDYYHKLNLDISSRHVSAYVDHNNGTRVVEASTKEFGIAKFLYKTSDVTAAANVGRVIAQRCKETGLYRVMWQHKRDRNHRKVRAFITAVSKSGIRLNEPRVRRALPPPGDLPR